MGSSAASVFSIVAISIVKYRSVALFTFSDVNIVGSARVNKSKYIIRFYSAGRYLKYRLVYIRLSVKANVPSKNVQILHSEVFVFYVLLCIMWVFYTHVLFPYITCQSNELNQLVASNIPCVMNACKNTTMPYIYSTLFCYS